MCCAWHGRACVDGDACAVLGHAHPRWWRTRPIPSSPTCFHLRLKTASWTATSLKSSSTACSLVLSGPEPPLHAPLELALITVDTADVAHRILRTPHCTHDMARVACTQACRLELGAYLSARKPLTWPARRAGTIPIYWGSASVMQTFDPAGILYVEDMSEVQVLSCLGTRSHVSIMGHAMGGLHLKAEGSP